METHAGRRGISSTRWFYRDGKPGKSPPPAVKTALRAVAAALRGVTRGADSSWRRRLWLVVVALVLAPAALAGCGGDSGGTPTLTWYINPDNGGQTTLAAGVLRRVRRRLPHHHPGPAERRRPPSASSSCAASPPATRSIDLMSLDPVFVAEFANAGYLEPVTDPADVEQLTDGVLDGRARDRLLGRPAGRHPVLGQHPAALVPQVGRRRPPASTRPRPTSPGTR